MPITRATNLAGLGTIFDSLTDGGGLSVSGISTFTDLNITRVNITGVGTISNGSITNLTGTSSTITTFTSTNGSITNLTGTSSTITTLRSTTLNADTGNIVTGVTTNFTSTNGTVTNLTGTSSTITTLRSTTGNFTTGNIVTGVTTNFNATNVVITGVTTVSAGTAALPSISPSGDPNTGVFFPSADTIAFGEGGAEAVRINSSGRLLVATSTDSGPNALVEVAVGGQNVAQFGRYTNSDIPPYVLLTKSRSETKGAHTVVQNNDGIGALSFLGSDGTQFVEGVRITAEVDGTPGANDIPGRLVFSTTADGGNTSTEAMRINNQKELLVGTTTRNANGGVLQLKSGITFPATAVAATDVNTLDDYEEGTWTPSNIYLVITNNFTAQYTKIGNVVTICGDVTFATTPADSSQASNIDGLPFTAKSGINYSVTYQYFTNATTGAVLYPTDIYVFLTGNTIYFYRRSGNHPETRATQAGRRFQFTATYTV